MCPPTRRRQCFNSDLLILILLCICFVSQLNWRKQFGRGLTATRSAGRRERPPSLSPNVSIKAWRRPPLPCSRTTPNTTEVRKENKPLTQVNNQVRQVREVREEIQETRCLTLKLSSTCRNPMQSLLWLVSSHRPEEAPPTMFPHQLCPAGGVAERVTVSLWHHGVTDVLTARLSYDTSSVFWFFHSIYDARIIKKKHFLRPSCPLCYAEFEPVMSWSFYLIPQTWTSTDPSLVYSSTMTNECYDEQLGDKCLTLLLGTWYQHTPTENKTLCGMT